MIINTRMFWNSEKRKKKKTSKQTAPGKWRTIQLLLYRLKFQKRISTRHRLLVDGGRPWISWKKWIFVRPREDETKINAVATRSRKKRWICVCVMCSTVMTIDDKKNSNAICYCETFCHISTQICQMGMCKFDIVAGIVRFSVLFSLCVTTKEEWKVNVN